MPIDTPPCDLLLTFARMCHMTLLAPMATMIPEWTLADRLRKARETTGLDQIEFAERSGISRTSITNYEQGKRAPRGLYLRAWSEATGVPVEWLETGTAPTEEVGAESSRLPESNWRPIHYE
ncbi:helix-turn-helix domain-containing protein [Leucobacter exalbidus]|uniref:helix-turn-helix domain-containing protein n=1 Tax=Leucobacter exalbidus TaxID=662960 RepID=UPI001AEACC89